MTLHTSCTLEQPLADWLGLRRSLHPLFVDIDWRWCEGGGRFITIAVIRDDEIFDRADQFRI